MWPQNSSSASASSASVHHALELRCDIFLVVAMNSTKRMIRFVRDISYILFLIRGCIKKYVDFYYNFKTTQRKSIKFCTRIKQLNVKRIIGFS